MWGVAVFLAKQPRQLKVCKNSGGGARVSEQEAACGPVLWGHVCPGDRELCWGPLLPSPSCRHVDWPWCEKEEALALQGWG